MQTDRSTGGGDMRITAACVGIIVGLLLSGCPGDEPPAQPTAPSQAEPAPAPVRPLRLAWTWTALGATEVQVAALADGRLVVGGAFSNQVQLGSEPGSALTENASTGGDGFIACIGADGRPAWAQTVGASMASGVVDIAACPDGGLVAVGTFAGGACFGAPEPRVTDQGMGDVFIARYGSDGALAWVRRLGGSSYGGGDTVAGVAVSPDGSVTAAGEFSGPITIGDSPTPALSLDMGTSVYVVRLAPDGSVGWASGLAGTYPSSAVGGIAALPDGGVVIAGSFSGDVSFGAPTGGRAIRLTSGGSTDGFYARYDAGGVVQWAKRLGGEMDDGCTAIGAASRGDRLVVTGFFTASVGPGGAADVLYSNGGRDMMVFGVDASDGAPVWARSGGAAEYDRGVRVALGSEGAVCVLGSIDATSSGPATFGSPGGGAVSLSSAGVADLFLACYTWNGPDVWADRAGGPMQEAASDVVLLPGGAVLVAGTGEGEISFGTASGGQPPLSLARRSAFLARYEP